MFNLINIHTYIHAYIHAYIHTYIHTYMAPFVVFDQRFSLQVSLIPPWEDQCEWHRMTRMTGPDCAVMCS